MRLERNAAFRAGAHHNGSLKPEAWVLGPAKTTLPEPLGSVAGPSNHRAASRWLRPRLRAAAGPRALGCTVVRFSSGFARFESSSPDVVAARATTQQSRPRSNGGWWRSEPAVVRGRTWCVEIGGLRQLQRRRPVRRRGCLRRQVGASRVRSLIAWRAAFRCSSPCRRECSARQGWAGRRSSLGLARFGGLL